MNLKFKTSHQLRKFIDNNEFFQEHHGKDPLVAEFLDWFCPRFAPDDGFVLCVDSEDVELITGWSCRAWHKAKGYELPC